MLLAKYIYFDIVRKIFNNMSHEENSQIPGQEMCSLNNDYTAASGKGEI